MYSLFVLEPTATDNLTPILLDRIVIDNYQILYFQVERTYVSLKEHA